MRTVYLIFTAATIAACLYILHTFDLAIASVSAVPVIIGFAYNGWSNYETWLAALWIDNEPYSQEYVLDLAREADYDPSTMRPLLEQGYDDLRPDIPSGLFSDLLNAAIGRIDWHELAEAYCEQARDDDGVAKCAICEVYYDTADLDHRGWCQGCASHEA